MDLTQQAGLYLHIPFCQRKCLYCSFTSSVPQPGEVQRYLEAVRQQMRQMATSPEIQALSFAAIFFGGGTPSMLSADALATLLDDCRTLFSCRSELLEISIEVNPGTIDADGLACLRQAGFNRLSIGVQSLVDAELLALGRIHDRETALATVKAGLQAGFDNLSLDLMYGLPGQTPDSWRQSLEQALALLPRHLSLYELTVEPGTPFAMQARQGYLPLPDEDDVLAMMAIIEEMVKPAGLCRYEISNYARPGMECRHNCNYWQNGMYLGLGPGAVSAYHGQRKAATADLAAFCHGIATGREIWSEVEQLDNEAAFRETVVMGLRMLAGVSIKALQERFGLEPISYYGTVADRLRQQGLLALSGERLMLTAKGLPLANLVMAQLV